MRAVIALSGVAVLGATAWLLLWKKSVPVISTPTGKGSSPTTNPYLNFNFGDLLSGDSNMTTIKPTPAPLGKPVPRGIANNNPLNVESNHIQWQGKVGDDGRFIIFETEHFGIRAAARILKTYRDKYHLDSVEQVVDRWAPHHENPTEKYIAFVASKAGVHPQSTLSAADYPLVIAAMIHFENGYNPYDQATIAAATAAGME